MTEIQKKELQQILSSSQISDSASDLKNYGKDWSIYHPANPSLIVFPENEKNVVDLVLWARKHKIPLVPSGGRTGLSSAATASQQEVVVSFDRMNKILDFNETDLVLTVEPGVITETVQNYAEEKGYYYPVDFAAVGSSQMGGTVATNAGGVKVVKYGLTRNWISGLRAVTGAGETLYLNKSLKKNATGYDLRHLFIGSEGTLGFLTQIEIQLTTQPQDLKVLILGLEKLEHSLDIFRTFNRKMSVTACEFFSQQALEKVLAAHTKLSAPFATETLFYLLLEVEQTSSDAAEKMESLFSECFENNWVVDGVISQNSTQSENFWSLREYISESISPFTPYKNDVSVRVSRAPDFVKTTQEIIQKNYPDWEVIWFGHIGDGNLHINILKPENLSKDDFIKKCQLADDLLYQQIAKFEGSISAEHGVGLAKKKFLHYTRSAQEIEILKQIKKIFDPDGIINPGKIF
ncbi:FAD-binding oxidoreductase [bacterium]|nr:FAD-binding oxidoreductase [bacterium]